MHAVCREEVRTPAIATLNVVVNLLTRLVSVFFVLVNLHPLHGCRSGMADDTAFRALRWKVDRLATIAFPQIDDHHPLADSVAFFLRLLALGSSWSTVRAGNPVQIRDDGTNSTAYTDRSAYLDKTTSTEAPF
jgi:hypothetical protein